MEKELYTKRRYKVVGEHSAVKLCAWTRNSLVGKGVCYKEQFYGIKSHRCLQMTPAVAWCSHACLFCWRPTEFTQGVTMKGVELNEPEFIVEEAIKAQRKLLTGFKGNPKTGKEIYKEAINPNQAAISLAGEPTLYPKLNGLIKEYHKRGFTTFLVTNGMNPGALKKLEELPTQLYVTLPACTKKMYLEVTRSTHGEKGWNRLITTLKLLPGLDTRRVIRLTLVKDLNMKNAGEYAKLIKIANPDFVEAKAYMHVGSSRERLKMKNMPSHEEIKTFSEELAEELDWKVIDEHKPSRVCLVAKEDYKWRLLPVNK